MSVPPSRSGKAHYPAIDVCSFLQCCHLVGCVGYWVLGVFFSDLHKRAWRVYHRAFN
jgi:hypothetical protein